MTYMVIRAALSIYLSFIQDQMLHTAAAAAAVLALILKQIVMRGYGLVTLTLTLLVSSMAREST